MRQTALNSSSNGFCCYICTYYCDQEEEQEDISDSKQLSKSNSKLDVMISRPIQDAYAQMFIKKSKGPGAIICDLTPQKLKEITSTYSALNPPTGRVSVYHHHLKGGLPLPVKSFVADVVQHFKVHLLQLAPNAMRKVVCFILISRILGVPPSLNLFRYFYIASPQGGWVSFYKRASVSELCLGLSNSLKKWKPEFFFVKSDAYPFPMTISDLSSRKSDPTPELSVHERVLVDRYSTYALWWTDPDKIPFMDSLDPKPSLLIDVVEAGLAQRLTLGRDVLDVKPSSSIRPSSTDVAISPDNVEPASSLNSSTLSAAGDEPAATGARCSVRNKGVPSKSITRKRRTILPSATETAVTGDVSPSTRELSPAREGASKRPRTSVSLSAPDEATETAESTPSSPHPDNLVECPVTDELLLPNAADSIPTSSNDAFVNEQSILEGLRRTVGLSFPSSDEGRNEVSLSSDCPITPVKPFPHPSSGIPISIASAPATDPFPMLPALSSGGMSSSSSAFVSTSNVSSLGSAFHRSLFISGAGKFVSSTAFDSKVLSAIPPTTAAPLCTAPSQGSIIVSAEASQETINPLSLGIAAILQIGKAAPMPTLASLATSFPTFSHGHVPTRFLAPPGSGNLSFEELINLGCTHMLHGLHFFYHVNSLGCNQCVGLPVKRLELDRVSALLENEQLNHQLLKSENDHLLQEVETANASNRLLLARLEENLETCALSSSEKEKSALADATSLSQQLGEFKALYIQKVADLDSLCSDRQVTITQHAKKIEAHEALIKELSLQVARSSEEGSKVCDEVYYHQHMADQCASDLLWLTQVGIPSCVRSVLRSDAFDENCTSLQEASMKLGQANAYAMLKDKYPSFFADKPDLFPVSGVKELVLERYEVLVNQEYELLQFRAATTDVDVELLKKKLESSGANLPK
ncbi:hypothetical protein LXL04_024048 [Taraxacum kok-saghyz]